jgi:PTS system nitrogen regulatory IIA component
MSDSILKRALMPACIRMRLQATQKEDVIREMVGILHEVHQLQDHPEALRVVLERERSMSTGLEQGLAIPHGKTDTVDRLIAALALKPEGLNFDSSDGKPAHIFLVTLSPASKSGPHIRLMAEVSRVIQSEKLRRQILEADSPETVIRLLTEG